MENELGAQPSIASLRAFWGGTITLTAKYSGKHAWDGQTAAELEGSREETWQLFPDDPSNKSVGGDVWKMRAVWRTKVSANGLITYKDSSTKETTEGERSDDVVVSVSIDPDGKYAISYFQRPPQEKKALKETTIRTERGAVTSKKVEETGLNTYMLFLGESEGSPSVSAYRIKGLIDPQDPATLAGALDFPSQGGGFGSWTRAAFGLDNHVKGPAQQTTVRLTWNLTRRPAKLKANPGGPYTVVRGETLILDGSASEGDIDFYEWTFAPPDADGGPIVAAAKSAGDAGQGDGGTGPQDAGQGDAGVPWIGNRAARKKGKKPSFSPLQKTKVTLTVIGKDGNDSETITVLVEDRDFKTKYDPKGDDRGVLPQLLPGQSPLVAGYTVLPVGGEAKIMVGTNLCQAPPLTSLAGYGLADHVLHVPGTWGAASLENIAYKLKMSDDEHGPFEGCWYVGEILFKIHRRIYLNPYFLPTGPPLSAWMSMAGTPDAGMPDDADKNWYEKMKEHSLEPDAYLSACLQHERTHSQLLKERLQEEEHDPGLKIEKVCGRDKDGLNIKLLEILIAANYELGKYMTDQLDLALPPGKFAVLWTGIIFTYEPSLGKWDFGPDTVYGYTSSKLD